MGEKQRHKSRRRTPWDMQEERTAMQEFICQQYQERYEKYHPNLTETGETELINLFVPKVCPYCQEEQIKLFGKTGNGIQRYRCQVCGQTFTPITKTIFEGHKISISEWIDYILKILRYVSISADSWNNRNAITTSRYWLEKLFLLLEEYQKGIHLSGRVWLDETYYRVRSEDIATTESGKALRGLSTNQMCIGVACDEKHTMELFIADFKSSINNPNLLYRRTADARGQSYMEGLIKSTYGYLVNFADCVMRLVKVTSKTTDRLKRELAGEITNEAEMLRSRYSLPKNIR